MPPCHHTQFVLCVIFYRVYVGIMRGCYVLLLDKSEFVELQILFGAGDFSPQNTYIFGTKVPCSDRYAPANGRFIDEVPSIPLSSKRSPPQVFLRRTSLSI